MSKAEEKPAYNPVKDVTFGFNEAGEPVCQFTMDGNYVTKVFTEQSLGVYLDELDRMSSVSGHVHNTVTIEAAQVTLHEMNGARKGTYNGGFSQDHIKVALG